MTNSGGAVQTSRNANGQTPKQGEKQPFNKTSQKTPSMNHGGWNRKKPGKDKSPFKKPSNDKKDVPRADMVCDNEHGQAARRHAGLHSRRSDMFNVY